MYYTIYQITNKINGMIYIGYHQTKNLEDNYMGSGKYIKRAIEAYGKENFEKVILKVFDNKEDAENYEAYIVNKKFTEREDTYNFALGGNVRAYAGKNNPMYGVRHSDELIEQIQKSAKKTVSDRGFLRNTPTEYWLTHKTGGVFYTQVELKKFYNVGTWKRVIVAIFNDMENIEFHLPTSIDFYKEEYEKIRIHTEEQKEKVRRECSARFLGMSRPDHIKQKISATNKGKPHPWNQIINKDPEKIRKMAETHRGMKRSPEAIENMRHAHLEKQKSNRLNPDHSPCNGKYLYHTPVGVFKNPHQANIDGLDGHQIALLCQFGNTDRKVTKKTNEAKFGGFFPESDYNKTYKELGFHYA